MATKILITGGAGFIGSHVCDLLVQEGYTIVIVDNLITGNKENINQEAVFYEADINDKDALMDIFDREKPEMVIHHAAQINVRKSVESPVFDAESNIVGTINVLECCKEYGVKKIIYASSGGAAYGEPEKIPCAEKHPTKPICHYGVSKYAAELYIHLYYVLYGIEYTILRYANVYGPRQDPKGEAGVISIFFQRIKENKNPVVFGDGTQTRDYVFVGDVAAANLSAVKNPALNTAVNIGTGKETSVNDLFEQIQKATKSDLKADHTDKIPGEIYRIALDASKAKKLLGWVPKTELDQGLLQTAEWFSSQ